MNKEVVHRNGMQASSHYVQGMINQLVIETSVSIVAPSTCIVFSSRVD